MWPASLSCSPFQGSIVAFPPPRATSLNSPRDEATDVVHRGFIFLAPQTSSAGVFPWPASAGVGALVVVEAEVLDQRLLSRDVVLPQEALERFALLKVIEQDAQRDPRASEDRVPAWTSSDRAVAMRWPLAASSSRMVRTCPP